MNLQFLALAILTLPGGFSQGPQETVQKLQESKLRRFLGQKSVQFISKKVNLPDTTGTYGDKFQIQVVSVQSSDKPAIKVRGVRFSGYPDVRVGGPSSTAFFDEDELSTIALSIRKLVIDAVPSTEVDMGKLGKQRVIGTFRLVSREGTEFEYDETLEGSYHIRIESKSYLAGSKQAFTRIADMLEKAAAILKNL